jgi:hypothetical protein
MTNAGELKTLDEAGDWLGRASLASYWGVGEGYVDKLRLEGALVSITVGRAVRISTASVRRYEAALTADAQSKRDALPRFNPHDQK